MDSSLALPHMPPLLICWHRVPPTPSAAALLAPPAVSPCGCLPHLSSRGIPTLCVPTHTHTHILACMFIHNVKYRLIHPDFIQRSCSLQNSLNQHIFVKNLCLWPFGELQRKDGGKKSSFCFYCMLIFFQCVLKALNSQISPLWCHIGVIPLLVQCLLHSFWDPIKATWFLSSSRHVEGRTKHQFEQVAVGCKQRAQYVVAVQELLSALWSVGYRIQLH